MYPYRCLMWQKVHYDYKYLLDLAIIFTLYKSAGAFGQEASTDAAGRWRASMDYCWDLPSRHSDRRHHFRSGSGDWCDRLMFCAGMETDIKELKACGKASFIIAPHRSTGTACGWICYGIFLQSMGMIESDASASIFLQNIFIG